MLKDLRACFDLGVAIELGDDEITVTGRNFLNGNPDDDEQYQERIWSFDSNKTLDEIYKSIYAQTTALKES